MLNTFVNSQQSHLISPCDTALFNILPNQAEQSLDLLLPNSNANELDISRGNFINDEHKIL